MNAGIYKLIFSKRLNALVVVGEICSSQGKAPGTTRALKRSAKGMFQIVKILGLFSSGALLVSSAWAAPAPDALPTGGQVVQGAASISQSNAQMDINQASQRAVINWQSFDVGADAKVHIVQPNQAAVLLNRVVTNKPSEIYGKIDANGQVILVNNNGIIFGKDGSASASSFTATTLDISDQDFMDGKTRYSSNGAQGEIVNQGTIEAKNGGYVALLGAKVTNDGKIITHNGSVALGAADSIAIPMTSSGKIKMQLSAGSINAAVENTKNAVIVTEGGDVYLQAAAVNGAMASIKHSGQIDTSGDQAGKAVLLADHGEIKVDGSITANSANAANKGGDIIIGRDIETGVLAKATDVSGASLESKKGFVETSGDYLKTTAVKVKASQWLLDPTNINIVGTLTGGTTPQLPATSGAGTDTYQPGASAPTSEILAADIGTALGNGTNVTITTTNSGTAGTDKGNITVSSAITAANSSGTDSTLTLNADNGIKVNANITATGSNKVNVALTALGSGNDADSGIKITKDIDVTGNLTLTGTANFATNAGVSIAPGTGLGGGTQTLKAGGDLSITGTSNIIGTGYGVCISSCGPAAYAAITNISSTTGKVSITGNTQTSRGVSFGGGAGLGPHAYNISAQTNVEIKGSTQGKLAATAYGVFENVSAQLNLASTTGSILIDGDASADTSSSSGQGVGLQGNVSFAATTSTISGKGRTTNPTANHGGVSIATTATPAQIINVTSGDLVISGTGGGYGLSFGSTAAGVGSTTISNPSGKITTTGTGNSGFGVSFSGNNIFKANTYTVDGVSASSIGINLSGTLNIDSPSNTANYFKGISSLSTGISLATGLNLTATNNLVLNGETAASNVGVSFASANINATNLTVSGKTSVAGVGVAGAGVQLTGTNTLNAISDITGTSVSGVGINNASTLNTNNSITLKGNSTSYVGFNGTSSITASKGTVRIIGNSTTTQYAAVNGTGTVRALDGNVIIDITSSNVGGYAAFINAITASGDIAISTTSPAPAKHGINLGGAINSTGGGVTIFSDVSASGSGSAINGVGTITAKNDINITGKSNGYYSINGLGAIESTDGKVTIDAWSGGSRALNLTNTVKAKGDVLLKGIGNNDNGVTIAAMVTSTGGVVDVVGTATGAGQGVVFNGATAGITANSYNVQGSAVSNNGVNLANGSFKSTSTTVDSFIEGKTTTGGTGLYATTGTLNFDSGAGKLFVRNTSDSNGGVQLRDGTIINTKGDVTFGRNDNGKSSLFLQGLRATADGGKLTFLGKSATENGVGFQDWGGTLTNIVGNNGAAILIDGESTASAAYAGVHMKMVSNVVHSVTSNGAGGSVKVNGKSATGTGVNVELAKITANDGNNIDIYGESGTGQGVYMASLMQANGGGNITIQGKSGSLAGASYGVYLNSNGGQGAIKADTGKIKIVGIVDAAAGTNSAIFSTGTITGGSVELEGISNRGYGVYSTGAITSTVADVSITGTSTATNNAYGVLSLGAILSKANLNIKGSGTTGYGVWLQNTIEAGGSIKIDGTSTNLHGVVSFSTITAKGKDSNEHAIDITGNVIGGNLLPAVNLTTGSAIYNKSSGGSTNISASQGFVYLNGTTITNDSSAGAINITAGNGTTASTANITSSAGATITQNSNAGINMTTDGVGNLTVAKIINNGTGNVNIGAGKLLAAGNAGGGQVKTVTGNSIAMNNGGKLFLYSGSLLNTGKLSDLNAGYNNLFYTGTGNALNTAFNQGYGDQIDAGQGSSSSTTQILFREALSTTPGAANQPSFTLTLADLSKTYGDADPTNQAAFNTAMQAAYSASYAANPANSPVLLTTKVGNNTFALAASEAISSLTGMTREIGEDVKANGAGYAYNGVAVADSSLNTSVVQSKMIINKRDITLTDIIASNKQYDGTNLASITGATLGNTVNGETLGLTGTAVGTFDGVNAQDGRTVTVSDVTGLTKVNGTGKWSNYNLTTTGSKTTTANITKRDVSLTSISADNKTYDGTKDAVISSGSITTGVGSETLKISGAGQFDDKNAGTNKTVTVADVSVLSKTNGDNGGDWNNYNLTTIGSMTTTANIAKKDVTLDGIRANDKAYDGKLDAVISSGSITTGVGSETLKISGTGLFDTKHFGTDKTVTVADVASLSQADGDNGGEWKNYNLTTSGVMTAKANISKADLTVTASQVTKTYDGTVNVDSANQANMGALAGQGAGETIASGVVQQFTDKNAGSNKTVRASGLTIKDTSNDDVTSNYNINYVDNNLSVIDQANLTVTASQVIKTYDGTLLVNSIDQALVGDLAGQAAGESVSNAATQQFTDKNAGSNKTVRASGLTIKDADNQDVTANYKIDYVDNTNSRIDKRSLVAELVGKVSKVYDGTTSIDNLTTDHVKVSNWAEGEGASVAGMTGYYVNKNVDANQGNGEVKANLGELSAKAGTNLDNYELPTKDLTANIGEITARALSVKVNDSMVIATQTANQASDQGFSYLGNQDGETAADIFGNNAPTAGDRVITGVDANQSLAVGSYTNAFGLNKNLTALHGNYNVTVQNGDLKVVPVDKLLITIASQSDEYGNRNAANAGLADTVSAQYVLDKSKAATGSNLVNLTMNRLADGRWQGTDSTNTNVVFSTLVNGAGFSTGGYLNAGNYQYDATPTTPKNNTNFNDSTVNGGLLTVTPRFIKTQIPVVKTYDGSDSLLGVDLVAQNAMSGDKIALGGAGHYSQKNVGTNLDYSFNGIHAVGADKANYAVTVENQSISGRDGIIKPRLLTVEGSSAASKVYDGTTAAVVTNGKLTGLVAGESLLLSSDGKFRSSALGAKIPVDVRYKLENGVKDLASNYTLDPNAVLYADIVEEAKQLLPAEVLVNPVPVNPTFVTPNTKIVINELVTTLHKDEQIQKQCSLEFSKECKAEPVTITDNAPRYVTFY